MPFVDNGRDYVACRVRFVHRVSSRSGCLVRAFASVVCYFMVVRLSCVLVHVCFVLCRVLFVCCLIVLRTPYLYLYPELVTDVSRQTPHRHRRRAPPPPPAP